MQKNVEFNAPLDTI